MFLNIFLLIVGFIMLVKGADFFVDGAAGIAKKMRIPELIIGLTIVAMGTSAPEAAVSITAGLKGNAEITIGNIVGSNILNTFIILGVASVIICMRVQKSTALLEIPYMLACSVLLLLLGMDGNINLTDGIILWLGFIIYLVYLFFHARKHPEEISDTKHRKLLLEIAMTIGGLAILVIGSRFCVDGASGLARYFGISERFIGLTIVALGTSLPELFTSVIASRKGNADIAVGNIVGSNIFNILFIVGTASMIVNVPFDSKFIYDSIVMIASVVLLFLFVVKRRKLDRLTGIVFLLCYAGYFTYILL